MASGTGAGIIATENSVNLIQYFKTCAASIAIVIATAASVGAAQLKTLGRLSIPRGTPVIAICTDSVMQTVLTQDFSVARRAGNAPGLPVTITVTMHQQVMQPGVSAQDVAPGDPVASNLLEDLGVAPMPLGDTGDQPSDPYEAVARLEATRPEDTISQALRQEQAQRNAMTQPGTQLFGQGEVAKEYPTAIVARVTSSAQDGSMTVAALVAPGESVRDAKELVAEEIANSVLH
jgi:hypothetical protein